MPPPQYFSKNKDKILIEMVRMNPVLYDDGHDNFRDKKLKRVIWENISAAIDVPIPIAKKRWRHFRDHYLKKCREGALDNPGRKSWEHFEHLHFLAFLYQERQKEKVPPVEMEPERIVYVVPPGEHDSFSGPEDAEPPDKRLRSNSLETVEIRSTPSPPALADASGLRILEAYSEAPQFSAFSPIENVPTVEGQRSAVHKFFESMADVVAQFPAALAAEARIKVCRIVNELELKAKAEVGCPRCRGWPSDKL